MPHAEKKYKDPASTVDIILRRTDNLKEILIEKRGREPFEGRYSLPGGHVDYGETVEAAVLRELREECGVEAKLTGILGVYSDPERDPRGQKITTVFLGLYAGGVVKGGDDADSAEWISLDKLLRLESDLAFDHHKILSDYASFLKSGERETFWSTKN